MSVYTPVMLSPKRQYAVYDRIFEIKEVVEIIDVTLASDRQAGYYIDVITKVVNSTNPPKDKITLESRISFDTEILLATPSDRLKNTLWRVGNFYHVNIIPVAVPQITIRIVPDSND